jgi:hypothetical protein
MEVDEGYYDPVLGIWWYSDEPSDTYSEWTLLVHLETYYEDLQINSPSNYSRMWRTFTIQYLHELDTTPWLSTEGLFHRQGDGYVEE